MSIEYSHIIPGIESLRLTPKMIQLYVSPIMWKGDPVGHVGENDALFFVERGECCVMIEDKSFIVKEGELAFLPRGMMRAYSTVNENTFSLYEIDFEAEINGKYWYSALDLKYGDYVIRPNSSEGIRALFEEAVRYEFNKSIIYDFTLCANTLQILKEYIFVRAVRDTMSLPFAPVTEYIENNLAKQIRIENLAALCYMQPTYFVKRFKAAFGDTPITYINKMRVYRALYLLASTKMNLSDIGKSVGIFDSSYFGRMFKSYCNTTPSEYRTHFSKRNKQ